MSSSSKPWGGVFLATFLVNLATLVGVITMSPCKKAVIKNIKETTVQNFISATSAGALIATSLLLVLPESSTNLMVTEEAHTEEVHTEEGHTEEVHTEEGHSEISFLFGLSVLLGFFLPIIISVFFPHGHATPADMDESNRGITVRQVEDKTIGAAMDENSIVDSVEEDNAAEEETQNEKEVQIAADEENDPRSIQRDITLSPQKKKFINWSLCVTVLLGDAFHNFGDGVFIGTAFLLCDRSLAISVAVVSLYHELIQELADFFVLTDHVGLSKPIALCFNFISGLTVILGGMIALALEMTDSTTGFILGIAGGVYIYIAACECIPRAFHSFGCKMDRVLFVLFSSLGAIPIGLVLLNHKHCEVHHEEVAA